jgi:hypothetical protein
MNILSSPLTTFHAQPFYFLQLPKYTIYSFTPLMHRNSALDTNGKAQILVSVVPSPT